MLNQIELLIDIKYVRHFDILYRPIKRFCVSKIRHTFYLYKA